jgi:hypothetical protein
MKPLSSKLQTKQTEETVATQKAEQKTAAREFQSVDEMLRYDAAQTRVPEQVEARLAESARREPAPKMPRSWWKRLLP